jgi:hypothetical protein
MEKVIKLGQRELRLHSSLYSIIEYRNVFGTELFNDLLKIEEKSKAHQGEFSLLINTIFKVIYVLHRPFSKLSYEEFMMSMEFDLLSEPDDLQLLSQTIADMLGTIKKDQPPSPQF